MQLILFRFLGWLPIRFDTLIDKEKVILFNEFKKGKEMEAFIDYENDEKWMIKRILMDQFEVLSLAIQLVILQSNMFSYFVF